MGRKKWSTEVQLELEAHQEELRSQWFDKSLPEDWNGLDTWDRHEGPKTRVTIRLDADMVKWFRKLGPNYSRRINAVLRIYWLALISGHIEGYVGDNTIPRFYLAAHERMRQIREG